MITYGDLYGTDCPDCGGTILDLWEHRPKDGALIPCPHCGADVTLVFTGVGGEIGLVSRPTTEQYLRESTENLFLSHTPTHACPRCKWPVRDGWACRTCGYGG